MPETEQETPLLDTILAMTGDSVERCGLEPDELILVRVAALAAMDAQPVSYLAHLGLAVDAGVTAERVQDVLIAAAPVIGTARTVAAGANIAQALGFAIAVFDEAQTA
jgi:alkylhydroperoxidase/carboxymuconolactone decarboxylase family protein YurZ